MIDEQPRSSGMHVLVADGSRAAAVEVTDTLVRSFDAEDGLLVRTNHYFAPDLAFLKPTFAENHSSYDRYARAMLMLRKRHGDISMHDILSLLSDHPPSLPEVAHISS